MHPARMSRNPFPMPVNPLKGVSPEHTRLIPAAEVGKPIPIPESECNQNPQPWQKRAAKLAKRARLFPTEREARRENARRALAEMVENAS